MKRKGGHAAFVVIDVGGETDTRIILISDKENPGVLKLPGGTQDDEETPEETATVTETASATVTATATTVATNVFNSPGSSLLVSGIQSGISFTVIIIIVLGIGGFVICRIIKE